MLLSSRRLLFCALVSLGIWGSACGARTGIELSDGGAGAPPRLCVVDTDCATGDACAPAQCLEGVCTPLPQKVCNDNNDCTADSCDPSTGKCSFTPVTLDLDGDGHRAPRPGFAPGAPGSCGDDCDDRSAAAHPGGVEVCDGVDNDCNGQIDDGAAYGGATMPVLVSSAMFDRTSRGALAFDGTNYGASYSGHQKIWSPYFTGLARNGAIVVDVTDMSDINAESYTGTLLHNGSYFVSTWSDARQGGNYEVYFNRFDSRGKKLGPDVRVTNAPNFSLNSSTVWNGTETVTVWDDRRFEHGSNDVRLFGQRVDFDGKLIGDNVQLTPAGTLAEYPAIALGKTNLGVVFASEVGPNVHAKFFTTAADLSNPSALVDVGTIDVQDPSIAYVNGNYVVAWARYGENGPEPSIFGAVINESGKLLTPEQPITSGANFARSFALLSLGERMLLVWADDHDGNYELYWQMLDQNLQVLTPRTRLTNTPSDTLNPAISFGPSGDIGILYDDWLTGQRETYFLSMGCVMADVKPPHPR